MNARIVDIGAPVSRFSGWIMAACGGGEVSYKTEGQAEGQMTFLEQAIRNRVECSAPRQVGQLHAVLATSATAVGETYITGNGSDLVASSTITGANSFVNDSAGRGPSRPVFNFFYKAVDLHLIMADSAGLGKVRSEYTIETGHV